MVQSFQFSQTPRVYFGAGEYDRIADRLEKGRNLLIVTGSDSLQKSGRLDQLTKQCTARSYAVYYASILGEPSPDAIDHICAEHRAKSIDQVIAIGGGSVMDAGKAIAAMLTVEGDTIEYLEGVGSRAHPGTTKPLIAVPTTAGTGSEATKNAVLSKPGKGGFKKSLRHDAFVPKMAIVDPALTLSCPPAITAASGMDALTQLIESYVSTKACPMTDSLCEKAISLVGKSLGPAATTAPDDLSHRAALSYGALISGIALANAGLGVVHGLASAIGGFVAIPHGVVCALFLPSATKSTLEQCLAQGNAKAVAKYERVRELIGDAYRAPGGWRGLVDILYSMRDEFALPELSVYGVVQEDIERIAHAANAKNNPALLSYDAVKAIVRECLNHRS